jgi:hypothetical protein
MKTVVAVAALCLCLNGWAQTVAPAASAPAAQGVEAAPAGPPQRGGEPKVQRNVDEDESVRVEELRVRGVTRRVTVQSKIPGAPAYEIRSDGDGRDHNQDRRSEGRSLWQLFAF